MLRKWMSLMLACLAMAACNLDKEEALRGELTRHLYLLEKVHFHSTSTCTAAVYTLALSEFRSKFTTAVSVRRALEWIGQGKPVHFYIPGASPNEISEQVMSLDLPSGLGLISAAVGPAQNCMPDNVARGYFRVLMSPDTQMVYFPARNALLMVYAPEKLAVYLRGNV